MHLLRLVIRARIILSAHLYNSTIHVLYSKVKYLKILIIICREIIKNVWLIYPCAVLLLSSEEDSRVFRLRGCHKVIDSTISCDITLVAAFKENLYNERSDMNIGTADTAATGISPMSFFQRFIFSTELISYFIVIPLLFLYFAVNLDISLANLMLLLKILAIVIPVSMFTTFLSDYIVIIPVLRYLKVREGAGEMASDIYDGACRRFFMLPYYHAFGSLIRWIAGLAMAYVPFTMLASLSRIQVVNVWTTAVIIPPFGMVLYFFLTERITQKYLFMGIFTSYSPGGRDLRVSFRMRIVVSTIIMVSLPVTAVIGYFLITLETAGVLASISAMKLFLILIFGFLVAGSLILTLTRSLTEKASIITDHLGKIGEGELATDPVPMAVMDDLAVINRGIQEMKGRIAGIISEIRTMTGLLDSSTVEIFKITDSFSEDTQNQAATIEEITATIEEAAANIEGISVNTTNQVDSLKDLVSGMDELTSTMEAMQEKTTGASKQTDDISNQARQGEESLQSMIESMRRISQGSSRMTDIISIINDISDQINLLSLNASIEAARAGDYGRGFAVVADEISKLAETTAASVKEIGTVISSSDKEVEEGIRIVNGVVEKMTMITRGVVSIKAMTDEIRAFMKKQIDGNVEVNSEVAGVMKKAGLIESSLIEQKNAMNEVSRSINTINSLTQRISSGAEEIAASMGENSGRAVDLRRMVELFRVS